MFTKNLKSFEVHLEETYGKIGEEKRDQFQSKAKAFAIGEIIKSNRKIRNSIIDLEVKNNSNFNLK